MMDPDALPGRFSVSGVRWSSDPSEYKDSWSPSLPHRETPPTLNESRRAAARDWMRAFLCPGERERETTETGVSKTHIQKQGKSSGLKLLRNTFERLQMCWSASSHPHKHLRDLQFWRLNSRWAAPGGNLSFCLYKSQYKCKHQLMHRLTMSNEHFFSCVSVS